MTVSGETVVATANVLYTLGPVQARTALKSVLDHAPDLVGLQEWGLSRRRLLRTPDYVWTTPILGACPVGARAARFEPIESRTGMLAGCLRAEKAGRWLALLPHWVDTVDVR